MKKRPDEHSRWKEGRLKKIKTADVAGGEGVARENKKSATMLS
jgi:hypothetical protein